MAFRTLIAILLIAFNTCDVISQNDAFLKNDLSSTDSILLKMESANNTINSSLNTIDSLFKNKKIKNLAFFKIATFLLSLKKPIGYEILLENCLKFEHHMYMNLTEVIEGRVFVIDNVIKTTSLQDLRPFVNYLFYSSHLNQKLTEEELKFIRSLFYHFADEYHLRRKKEKLSPEKEANFNSIFGY